MNRPGAGGELRRKAFIERIMYPTRGTLSTTVQAPSKCTRRPGSTVASSASDRPPRGLPRLDDVMLRRSRVGRHGIVFRCDLATSGPSGRREGSPHVPGFPAFWAGVGIAAVQGWEQPSLEHSLHAATWLPSDAERAVVHWQEPTWLRRGGGCRERKGEGEDGERVGLWLGAGRSVRERTGGLELHTQTPSLQSRFFDLRAGHTQCSIRTTRHCPRLDVSSGHDTLAT